MTRTSRSVVFISLLSTTIACSDDGDEHGNETEVITTVTMTFALDGSGESVVASFRDPDGDGGMSGTMDPVALAVDATYTMSITLLDELGSPPEDITAEVEAEAEAHQFLVFGTAVSGPCDR